MTDPENEDLEIGFDDSATPDVLSCPNGQVYLYPDAATFCDERQASALMLTDAGLFYLPEAGGKWTNVEDYGKPSPEKRGLRSVQ